ncbi:hypothetical protein BGX29_001107 [Mortierella sp. GBA35]|nr:hypothetical protein BGX29_001107 [Mortierella sp. GBA35]
MSSAELSKFKSFKVGLPRLGSVEFLEPVDSTTFSPKTCVVYLEVQNKPRPGEGLNVPAIISPQDCWPSSRHSRQPMDYTKSSRRFSAYVDRLKAIAVGYFSIYGLSDDEEDEKEDATQGQGGRRALPRTAAAATSGTAVADDATYHAYGTSPDHRVAHSRLADAMDMEQDESSGAEDSLRRSSLNLADAGLMIERICRVGWGPNGMMAVCGTVCGFEATKERYAPPVTGVYTPIPWLCQGRGI